jgi:two-component system, chemotaxis family, CheB/CheR fusion protein
MHIMPYRTAENLIDGVVITLVDIHPIKAAQQELLRMSKAFLEGPLPMLLLDLQGSMIAVNDEAERAYGWSRQEMLAKPFQMILAQVEAPSLVDTLRACAAGETLRDRECNIITKAGRKMAGSISLKLLTDDHGLPESICVLAKSFVP